MKTSRAVFTEVQKKAGPFPFNVRVLEDEKRARMGLQEAVQHSLVKPYEVVYAPSRSEPRTLYVDERDLDTRHLTPSSLPSISRLLCSQAALRY